MGSILKHIPSAILVILLLLGISCRDNTKNALSAEGTNKGFRNYSSIEAKLDSLSKAPKQRDLNPGAMCYKVAFDRTTETFICSKCKKGTVYNAKEYNRIIEAKRILESIKNIKIIVDDSGFCSNCSKGNVIYKFKLTIQYPDRTEPVYSEIHLNEVSLLKQFLEGKLVFRSENDNEEEMKNYLEKLKKILLGK